MLRSDFFSAAQQFEEKRPVMNGTCATIPSLVALENFIEQLEDQ